MIIQHGQTFVLFKILINFNKSPTNVRHLISKRSKNNSAVGLKQNTKQQGHLTIYSAKQHNSPSQQRRCYETEGMDPVY